LGSGDAPAGGFLRYPGPVAFAHGNRCC
jgi:hypothetical protein